MAWKIYYKKQFGFSYIYKRIYREQNLSLFCLIVVELHLLGTSSLCTAVDVTNCNPLKNNVKSLVSNFLFLPRVILGRLPDFLYFFFLEIRFVLKPLLSIGSRLVPHLNILRVVIPRL
jgi:hypothetical protein